MEALFQVGKELGELRCRVEALEQKRCGCREQPPPAGSPDASGRIRVVGRELAPTEALVASAGLVHRVPRVPLLLNGSLVKESSEVTKYNGRPLFYTPLRTRSGVVLAAFTEWKTMITE